MSSVKASLNALRVSRQDIHFLMTEVQHQQRLCFTQRFVSLEEQRLSSSANPPCIRLKSACDAFGITVQRIFQRNCT